MAVSYLGAKILLTGADGFIGSHLTEALVSAGAEVTALAQYNSFDSHGWLDDLPEQIRGKINLVRGDVRDFAALSVVALPMGVWVCPATDAPLGVLYRERDLTDRPCTASPCQ